MPIGNRIGKLLNRIYLWAAIAVAAVLVAAAVYHLSSARMGVSPTVPVVTNCKDLKSGMRRIGDQNGFHFDVPENEFIIHQEATDASPLIQTFRISLKSTKSELEISFPHRPMESMATDPTRTFSSGFEQRKILDASGQQVGEDYWGYLKSGERWRQFRLYRGAVIAKYGFVDEHEAQLFDRIINSVCYISQPAS